MIVLSLYWTADQFRFERFGLSFIPEEHHSKALHVWRSVETGVGAYLRSEMVQSVTGWNIALAGLFDAGNQIPALLAGWGAIARLIPWFGAVIAVSPGLGHWDRSFIHGGPAGNRHIRSRFCSY